MIITKFSLRFSLIALLLSLTIVGCSDESSTQRSHKKQAHLVEIQQAGIQAVRTRLSTSGSLKAERQVRIYNEISAKIRELPFYPGDRVNKGDVLVTLDNSIIAAERDKARALRKQAEQDYARLKQLKPKKLASDEEIARAMTELEITRADEKLQLTRLQQTSLRAPFSGVITERFFEPGDVVALHSHILSLIDPDSLHLVVQLAEQWMPYVSVGDHVMVSIDALGEMQHDASISRIYPGIDELTRKGTIEVSFEPQPFGAQPGQLARVQLYTQSVDQLVIPAQSLHHDSSGAYVYVLNDEGKTHKSHVVTGQQYGDLLAISSGLSTDSRVVTKGFIGLRDGKQVKVVEHRESPQARPLP